MRHMDKPTHFALELPSVPALNLTLALNPLHNLTLAPNLNPPQLLGRRGLQGISTSAGERTDVSSRATGKSGKWTARTLQP
jgi:hypothetical protein